MGMCRVDVGGSRMMEIPSHAYFTSVKFMLSNGTSVGDRGTFVRSGETSRDKIYGLFISGACNRLNIMMSRYLIINR